MHTKIGILIVAIAVMMSCRGPEIYIMGEEEQVGKPVPSEVMGFYVLCEGNMGSNKASLDYYDFATATYTRNIYQQRNPSVSQSLGDVGNDLQIYGSKLYAVINCSNMVEVMTADSAKHIATINCPNCRNLCFHEGYTYLTSYAGPVEIGSEHAQIGYVAKIDTATMQIVNTCCVGYQPDEMCVVGKRLYVANSGGYMVPNYEHELSVIDLESFKEVNRIPVAINLQHVCCDRFGQIWVSNRGDYGTIASRLYCVDAQQERVVDSIPMSVGSMWLDGDSLYISGASLLGSGGAGFGVVNVKTHRLSRFEVACNLMVPYGIAVHPITRDVYLTDAKTYVNPGTLWCLQPFGNDGDVLQSQWSVRTGDIPAHVAFWCRY